MNLKIRDMLYIHRFVLVIINKSKFIYDIYPLLHNFVNYFIFNSLHNNTATIEYYLLIGLHNNLILLNKVFE